MRSSPEKLQRLVSRGDYSMIICEKPDVARKIAYALSDGEIESYRSGGVEVLSIRNGSGRYVICSASGHLYTLAPVQKNRSVYPVYDPDWVPRCEVRGEKKKEYLRRKLDAIRAVASNASGFFNACDFDQEGETLGYNILRYACGGREESASRAKFSTLTSSELREAFSNARPGIGGGMAEAGRTRHLIDFIYGVNLSRALTEACRMSRKGYRNISIGRVQGPTLTFLVERESEIRAHVPGPYWKITAVVRSGGIEGREMKAGYNVERIPSMREAEAIMDECGGRDGIVNQFRRTTFHQPPPTPFNLGDLQREAYRVFRFSPSLTLSIAERLYLDALISYPRTSSQKIPPSVNCRAIISGLSRVYVFEGDAKELLAKNDLRPNQGKVDDPAHPAIYPTGETPGRKLEPMVFRLYDLIVRRFLSLFGKQALRERVAVSIGIGRHEFRLGATSLIEEGWTRYYRRYAGRGNAPLPQLREGQIVKVVRLEQDEKMTEPSPRFNQATLLAKMEEEGIGTKATRAETIRTLLSRGYLNGNLMEATDLAFAIVEAMRSYCPVILSSGLTRELERELEGIETGETASNVTIESAVDRLDKSLVSIRMAEDEIGRQLADAVERSQKLERRLGNCPTCGDGDLVVMRSSGGKRFAACTNYRVSGCKASAPLPQRGVIIPLDKRCDTCQWPIIQTRFRGRIWRPCINQACPSKRRRKSKEVVEA